MDEAFTLVNEPENNASCQICENLKGTVYCTDCRQLLCAECDDFSHVSASFDNHNRTQLNLDGKKDQKKKKKKDKTSKDKKKKKKRLQDVVQDLKANLFGMESREEQDDQLTQDDRLVSDDQLAESCDPTSPTLNISITFLGRNIPMQLEPQITVKLLKEKLLDHEGIPAMQQRLTFRNVKLSQDDWNLADYGISEGSTLVLAVRSRPPSEQTKKLRNKSLRNRLDIVTKEKGWSALCSSCQELQASLFCVECNSIFCETCDVCYGVGIMPVPRGEIENWMTPSEWSTDR